MSDLYNRIMSLCEKKGVSGYRMCKDIKIQPSILTDLKMGRQSGLSAKNADKMAAYFGVSVGFLLGTETKKAPTLTKKDERDIARKLDEIMNDLENSGTLMFDGDPMSDEARESMRAAIKLGLEAAKLKNKERFTPKKYRKD